MEKVAIFFDGGYIAKIVQDEFGAVGIDFAKFSQEIGRRISAKIYRSYYYNCLPYKSDPPTKWESRRFASAQRFHQALRTIPRFEVRLGRLAVRTDNNGDIFYEQKMVDTLLSIDMVYLSTKQTVTDIAIVAGDSDFIPALEMVKREGITVWLFHGKSHHRHLWETADERIRITKEFINAIKLDDR